MKTPISVILFAVSLVTCASVSNPVTERQLIRMLDEKDIFRLETALREKRPEISKSTALFLDAHLQNAFNQTEQSLQTIGSLLDKYGKTLNDTLLFNVYAVKYDNLHKQTRYREAVEALEIAINNYGHTADSAYLSSLRETYNSVAPLKEFAPLKTHIAADITIPTSRNRFGHLIMKTTNGTSSEDFIFDTGAMQSVVSESCARRMGIRVLESAVNVGNSTGSTVRSKVGIADSLRIGDLLLENVAFLVLPDETLSFPQVDYYIHGIIGFPVMYQMKEIVISKDESIFIPAVPAKCGLHNMFLDGFSPFVQLEANGDVVVFQMDTGADTSEFSEKYFAANKDKIAAETSAETIKRGGAGGIVESEVYRLTDVRLKIGGREFAVPDMAVLTEKLSFLENCDGNLGQDVLMHFNKLILNFEDMYLAFED